MNYLQLCQRVHLLLRIGEDRPGSAPLTVAAQQGVLAEIVGWVAMAYEDIQRSKTHWLFMTGNGIMAMNIGVSEQNPATQGISSYSKYLGSEADGKRSFVGVYTLTPADETPCFYIPYEQWILGVYERGVSSAGNGRPAYFTSLPNGKLAFYPKPDIAYNVRIPYSRSVHSLTVDADTPIIPVEHQMAIVWRAIRDYYCTTRENTREIRAAANEQCKSAMYALHRDQLPEFTVD